MISASIVKQIRRLLAEGKLSHRKIACMMGVSRGTVGAVAKGRRPDYPERESAEEPSGPLERCPGCGGMVYLPCRLCRLRQAMQERCGTRVAGRYAAEEDPLQLDLRGEHRLRYERIRAQHMANGIS